MSKARSRSGRQPSPGAEQTPTFLEGDLSQGNNPPQSGHQRKGSFQELSAGSNFCCCRAIVRRRAVDNGCNENPSELQSIATVTGMGLRCKAGLVEGTVEEVTGAVTGKHSPGAVCPVCCRRQANDEELCLRGAEIRYWLAPVRPPPVCCPLPLGNQRAVLAQPRTAFALSNLLLQLFPLIHSGLPARRCSIPPAHSCTAGTARARVPRGVVRYNSSTGTSPPLGS